MSFIELFLIGVGLSMDAFAAAICQGLFMTRIKWGHALTVGLYFGGFQALMPFIGYLLGAEFEKYINAVASWIAFVLLAVIGADMIKDSFSKEEECPDASFGFKTMLTLAVATSIDALAVGITFAFLGVNIVSAISIIGCTTFCISVAGVAVGCWFGARYKKRAEITGGAILVLLGIKILLEHLGMLAF